MQGRGQINQIYLIKDVIFPYASLKTKQLHVVWQLWQVNLQLKPMQMQQEWRWLFLSQTATHQTLYSARLFQLIIHSLPLHEAVKQTPPQVPEDPRGWGQEEEVERGWWDILFKPHTHTRTPSTSSPSFFPICLLPCITHPPLCSPSPHQPWFLSLLLQE